MLRRFLQRRSGFPVMILALAALATLIGGAVYAAGQSPTPNTAKP